MRTSRPGCRGHWPGGGSPRGSGCAGRWAARWPKTATWRCCPRRSRPGPTRTCSGCRPRTCDGPRWSSPTRSARMNRCCAPRCCPGCCGPGAEHRTGFRRHGAVRDRPGLPAAARSAPAGAPSSPWTAGPRWRSWPRWKPRCPTSRSTSRPSWPALASWTDGGGRVVRRRGRTRSRRPARPARICRVPLEIRADKQAAVAPGALRGDLRAGRLGRGPGVASRVRGRAAPRG